MQMLQIRFILAEMLPHPLPRCKPVMLNQDDLLNEKKKRSVAEQTNVGFLCISIKQQDQNCQNNCKN